MRIFSPPIILQWINCALSCVIVTRVATENVICENKFVELTHKHSVKYFQKQKKKNVYFWYSYVRLLYLEIIAYILYSWCSIFLNLNS